jgi:transposase, IS30 family
MPGIALNAEEREEIRAGLERGETCRKIAGSLRRSPSTISREVSRNGSRNGYSAVYAQRATNFRRHRPKKLKLAADPQLGRIVRLELVRGMSPAAIASRLKGQISTETIYRTIYAKALGDLLPSTCLRTRRHRRKKRIRPEERKQKRLSWRSRAQSIDQRPDIADRVEPGHWEGDQIIGANHGSAVITLVERKTRYLILLAVGHDQGSPTVSERIINAFKRIPRKLRRSLTWDQGAEIAGWATIQNRTGLNVYLCHPSSPWERASNENINRLVRFWLPKKVNLSKYTQHDLNRITKTINNLPRRLHNWQTAQQIYNQQVH